MNWLNLNMLSPVLQARANNSLVLVVVSVLVVLVKQSLKVTVVILCEECMLCKNNLTKLKNAVHCFEKDVRKTMLQQLLLLDTQMPANQHL